MWPTISTDKILLLIPRRSFYIIYKSISISANARRKCHFVVLISATTESVCWNDVNNSTADRYPLLNPKNRRKYTVLIKFDIGIPMLARTMSHWYRLDAVPLSMRWNSVVEATSTIRYRIDHFTSPTLSYAILYHFDIATDIESIWTWCSTAIWEKFYDMASYSETNT